MKRQLLFLILPMFSSQNRFNKHALDHLSADFVPAASVFTEGEKGFSLNGQHHLSVKQSFENMLLTGATGIGKSSSIIIPSLAKMEGSLIVHDPARELCEIMGDDLQKRGYTIEIIDFSDATRSSGFNLLSHIQGETEMAQLADLLVRAGKQVRSDEEHWLNRASELIQALIHLALKLHGETANLKQVNDLLLEAKFNVKPVGDLFDSLATPPYQRIFRALTKDQTNELSSIFSTALTAMKDFNNPNIAAVTAKNQLDFDRIRQQKTAIFIQNSTGQSHLYTKLISIFFELLFAKSMVKIPEESALDLFFVIDELGSLSLPTLSYKINETRKFRMAFLLVIQSLGILERAYGANTKVITDNCRTHVYLGAVKGKTAIELERALGHQSNQQFRFARDKARMLPDNTALILRDGCPPVLDKHIPYYQHPALQYLQKNKGETSSNWTWREDDLFNL